MIRELFKKAPYHFQTPIRWIYGKVPIAIRLGRNFTETYNLLKVSQYWSKEEHESYQLAQLKRLLIHSFENVPYYNKLFNEIGFNPYTFRYLDEMEKIPFLDKETVQNNFESLIAKNIPRKDFILQTTGGTSGNPLKFFIQKKFSLSREWAFMTSQWGRVGFNYRSSKRVLLTNSILPKNKLYLWDYINNCLVIDPYHLTEENIKRIVDKLNDEKIPFIHTYPSAITIICDYIKDTGHNLSYSPKAIFCSSENIYKGQREFIESNLNSRVFSWYGHTEKLVLAGECEKSNLYHIFSEYGYTELVDENNRVIKPPNIRGEIVGTGFNNYVMPLIRYKTGDYSEYAENQLCECGRHYKLLKGVEGRWLQEMLVTSKGNKISITAINMHSDIFDNVKQFQFYQNKPGFCILRIVKKPSYSAQDEANIVKELKKKLTDEISLDIEYVNEIERTSRGKYKFLIQEIDVISNYNS
ncbi:phenylacetate--CoA ligase family protein [Aeribacillus pallidus]|uniref:Uncharacterized protein n=1 Tax=Aeribacillus pallidus TaxID=33936 RepID=A0A223E2L7_9BACI|nr:phenylacetate--CoA ligase family protein [Aeribacillus pallidus]ASS89472.1 hypothetical protein AP3564_03710 [Aeribacillus pallidus]